MKSKLGDVMYVRFDEQNKPVQMVYAGNGQTVSRMYYELYILGKAKKARVNADDSEELPAGETGQTRLSNGA